MDILDKLSDLEVFALTLYGESRGEPIQGQVAVGCVIRNRVEKSVHKSYKEACLQRFQFSCWNENDPNRNILLEMGEKILNQESVNDIYFSQCKFLAIGIMNGSLIDNTKGANHYMTWDLFNSKKKPSWAKNAKNLQTKGNQIFFNI
jgi:N-acetylmuramoyl-L-alanine amidase